MLSFSSSSAAVSKPVQFPGNNPKSDKVYVSLNDLEASAPPVNSLSAFIPESINQYHNHNHHHQQQQPSSSWYAQCNKVRTVVRRLLIVALMLIASIVARNGIDVYRAISVKKRNQHSLLELSSSGNQREFKFAAEIVAALNSISIMFACLIIVYTAILLRLDIGNPRHQTIFTSTTGKIIKSLVFFVLLNVLIEIIAAIGLSVVAAK